MPQSGALRLLLGAAGLCTLLAWATGGMERTLFSVLGLGLLILAPYLWHSRGRRAREKAFAAQAEFTARLVERMKRP